MFNRRRISSLLGVTGALVTAGSLSYLPSASAATQPEAASGNWSGYVAGPANGGSNFSSVSGSWVQPSANASGGDGYSAFWVGLGGSGQSQSLEQTGTEADVSNGQTSYFAWYELVPAAPVRVNLAIHPGDHISAKVTVSGTNVTVSLSDQTTGQSFTKTLQMSNPDTSSAEWIAEAPSASDGQGDMTPLSLADFGTVTFMASSATAAGHEGSISDPSWDATPVALNSSNATAQPGALSSDGSSFAVSWQGAQNVSDPYGGGGGGYSGDPYGGGGYGGYADGGGGPSVIVIPY